ncbi:MAG: ribulose-phosphate 3-epimerase [Planctomycetota bacterium]
MSKIIVAPSVLSADFAKLNDEIQAIEAAGAEWLHVDVMDGHFVPNITMGPFIVAALKRLSKLPLDCHLMIENPERYVEAFVKAGASWITVHLEAKGDIHGALKLARKLGARPALSIRPATPVSAVASFIKEIEMLLIMTVNPGFSGQQLMSECLPKYAEARKLFGPNLLLQIDGGVTVDNVESVRAAGVNVIVAATAIFKSKNYTETVCLLKGL